MSIEFNDVKKYYGKSKGVEHLNLKVETGDFFGFVGPNGAGKTTAIKALLNLIIPDAGSLKILGVETKTDIKRIKPLIGYMPSEVNLYEDFTVSELLNMNRSLYLTEENARLLGHTNKLIFESDMRTLEKEMIQRLMIDPTKKFKALSLGNRKKIGFVLSTVHRPKVLILDEPTSGLDPLVQDELMKLLIKFNLEGMTIMLSSHTLSEVENNCKSVGLIKDGRMLKHETMEDLKGHNLKTVDLVINRSELSHLDMWSRENGAIRLDDIRDLGNLVKVTYKMPQDIHTILLSLSQLNLEDVSIYNPSLETLFMHYYHQEVAHV